MLSRSVNPLSTGPHHSSLKSTATAIILHDSGTVPQMNLILRSSVGVGLWVGLHFSHSCIFNVKQKPSFCAVLGGFGQDLIWFQLVFDVIEPYREVIFPAKHRSPLYQRASDVWRLFELHWSSHREQIDITDPAWMGRSLVCLLRFIVEGIGEILVGKKTRNVQIPDLYLISMCGRRERVSQWVNCFAKELRICSLSNTGIVLHIVMAHYLYMLVYLAW